jgi:hypothetical protein
LFTYLYTRQWPAELRFELELGIVGAAAVLLCLALIVPAWRRGLIIGLAATALVFALWCADIYFPKVALHWGQRELIAQYYQLRQSPDEPLAAYAQNWMGENFYTGNHVATFKSPGDNFKRWLRELRAQGTRVLFVTTEHGRVAGLRGQLGEVQAFELVTTPQQNNKFVLARVTL